MTKYKKKPVVIEAMQFDGENGKEIEDWAKQENCQRHMDNSQKDYLTIQTLEGIMTASKGDFIIKGISGEFYPCKPDIFELTYEKV